MPQETWKSPKVKHVSPVELSFPRGRGRAAEGHGRPQGRNSAGGGTGVGPGGHRRY